MPQGTCRPHYGVAEVTVGPPIVPTGRRIRRWGRPQPSPSSGRLRAQPAGRDRPL